MAYTIDHFINKFESIPEEQWCAGSSKDEDGRRCAYGHCDSDLFDLFLLVRPWFYIATINDGKDQQYQQQTPKQRVLAALRDIKAQMESKR